jgi:hypothetical protein
MTNTGWQIIRCITSVSSYDNSKPLDRNGMECNLLDVDSIPVSAAGLKQAAKVLDTVNISIETPVGQSKTYSQLYDILGRYTVSTTGVPTSSFVYQDGVIVARYRGASGQSCEVASVTVFSTSPTSAILLPKGLLTSAVNFNITSTVDGVAREWIISSLPSWLTLVKATPLLTISSYLRNLDTSDRTDEIYATPSRADGINLTQNTSGETLAIPVSQEGLTIKRFVVENDGDRVTIGLNSITDYLPSLIDITYRLVSIVVGDVNHLVNITILEVGSDSGHGYVRLSSSIASYGHPDNLAFAIID